MGSNIDGVGAGVVVGVIVAVGVKVGGVVEVEDGEGVNEGTTVSVSVGSIEELPHEYNAKGAKKISIVLIVETFIE